MTNLCPWCHHPVVLHCGHDMMCQHQEDGRYCNCWDSDKPVPS